jgi:HEAT repeat protein
MQLRPCPYCDKPIPKKITVCPYCHRDEGGKSVRIDTAAPVPESGEKYYEDDMTDLASSDPVIREQAVIRMAQHGFGVVQALISVLSDLGKPGLAATAKVLGRIRDKRSVPALANAMRMGDEDLRTASVWSLGQFREPEVLSIFLSEVGRQHPAVQAYIAFVLGGFHDSQALPVLGKLVKHPNREVAFQAAAALGEIGDVQAVPGLRRALRHKDLLVRTIAAGSLRRLGASPISLGGRSMGMILGGIAAAALAAAYWFYR